MTWLSNTRNISQRQLFIEATYDSKEIIERFCIRFIRSDNHGKILKSIENDELSKHYMLEIRHRKFGRCYSFHPNEELKKLGIYYIRIKL